MRPGSHEEVTLIAAVDGHAARQLNMGDAHLEATLVLHTARGKDSFIAINAKYGESSLFQCLVTFTLIAHCIRDRAHMFCHEHTTPSTAARSR